MDEEEEMQGVDPLEEHKFLYDFHQIKRRLMGSFRTFSDNQLMFRARWILHRVSRLKDRNWRAVDHHGAILCALGGVSGRRR